MSAFGTVRPRLNQRVANLLPKQYQEIGVAKYEYRTSKGSDKVELIVKLNDNTVLRREYNSDANGNERPISDWSIV